VIIGAAMPALKQVYYKIKKNEKLFVYIISNLYLNNNIPSAVQVCR
jgi:hypothetical protein